MYEEEGVKQTVQKCKIIFVRRSNEHLKNTFSHGEHTYIYWQQFVKTYKTLSFQFSRTGTGNIARWIIVHLLDRKKDFPKKKKKMMLMRDLYRDNFPWYKTIALGNKMGPIILFLLFGSSVYCSQNIESLNTSGLSDATTSLGNVAESNAVERDEVLLESGRLLIMHLKHLCKVSNKTKF